MLSLQKKKSCFLWYCKLKQQTYGRFSGSDPQLFWAHPTSHATGAPDLHTPLSSVLLASPRHRLAAMLQKWGLADSDTVAAATSTVASAAHKKVPPVFLKPKSDMGCRMKMMIRWFCDGQSFLWIKRSDGRFNYGFQTLLHGERHPCGLRSTKRF